MSLFSGPAPGPPLAVNNKSDPQMPCKGEDLPRVHLLGQEPPGEEFYHLLIAAGRKLQTSPCSSVHKPLKVSCSAADPALGRRDNEGSKTLFLPSPGS